MRDNIVVIAGGGIGGLATALTLHQIGVPCIVFEAVREMRPLGVGINLQPNAVRELYDLDVSEKDLDRVGLPATEWALVGLNGNDIYAEPRALEQLDETVAECIGAAADIGISADDLEKAAGGSLKEYLRAAIIDTSE